MASFRVPHPATSQHAHIWCRGDRAYASLGGERYEYHLNDAPFGHKPVAWLYVSSPALHARDCAALGILEPPLPYLVRSSDLELDPRGFTVCLHIREAVNTAGGGYRLSPRERHARFVRA
jgi:hypothetical protein